MTTETINRTGPAWETDEEITPKDPKSYLGLIFGRAWQTHLPPSPEGQLLASADYCTESGDIAHFILDPKSREIIIACFDSCFNEPEELCYFLKQENGLMAPVTKAESRKALAESRKALDRLMAPVTKAESRKALDRLNTNAKIEWSYSTTHRGPAQTETIPAHGTRPHPRFGRHVRRPRVARPVPPEVQRGYPIIVFLYGMPGPDAYHPPERRPHPGVGKAPRHEAVLLPAD